ncbi:MAG: DegQ family serine endoprotease [Verrucomicrobia bacterium]|nr:DegQ family serine endoprotease [Verrucomicrobiota bacterium]
MNHPITRSSSLKPRLAAVSVLGAFALAGALFAATGGSSTKPAIDLKRDASPVNRGQLEVGSFSGIVKHVSPSVVKITTEIKAKRVAANATELPPGFDNPMFRQFFGNRMPEMQTQPQSGLGSGVIISADGYIATNNHVVDGADIVTVALTDGREFTAKVVGRDPQTDLAVVKIDAKDLPAITLADSSKTEVGDRVLAIGNPFGIGETVTSGIVSAKGRNIGILAEVEGYEDFIQTDAAINPGNSGGALVDVSGRLVGINTAILSRTGGFQGVGLAVPANLVSQVADSLVKTGKVTRGYLGVNLNQITPALAEAFHLKDNKGALVSATVPDSPADKAGLKSGDVIVALEGQPVSDPNSLKNQVSAFAPGTKLNLEILRDGKTEKIAVTTADKPGAKQIGKSRDALSKNNANDEGVLNGVAVDDLDRNGRRELNLPAKLKGALITQVDPASASARAGLKPGDVILEINRQAVTSAKDAIELSTKAESKKTLLKLWSRGNTLFVVVDETGSDKDGSN